MSLFEIIGRLYVANQLLSQEIERLKGEQVPRSDAPHAIYRPEEERSE